MGEGGEGWLSVEKWVRSSTWERPTEVRAVRIP